ncbi:hypothetical protein VH567_07870 [Sphingomonas sp. 4RDLI-65]|uniref:hypothetical protein n=1 Tax=Sphingomonas sp. 4RDLI-65 TaxID=3111641 RepID=UPI003C18A883
MASGAIDAGNPVKVGGEYLSTAPVFTNGMRGDLQIAANGSLYIDTSRNVNQKSPTVDAQAAATGLNTYSQNMCFNGTTWDRVRGDANGSYMQTVGTATGIADGASNFITIPRTPAGAGINTLNFPLYFNGTGWDRQRGDITGTWTHAPASAASNALSGTITTSGATAAVAFINTARQEIINPSASTLWASWGAPAVNGAGSFPIAPGGSFSADRTAGTLTVLSTVAAQPYTVHRYV